jgi:hypothetical protein
MKTCRDSTEAETLQRSIEDLERLAAKFRGKCSYEVERSIRDALSSLRRCQDYFKEDSDQATTILISEKLR